MEENQKILLEAAEEKMDGREIKSKRRPNEKHFKRADGTYEARLYSEPVHYYDEQPAAMRSTVHHSAKKMRNM